MKTSDFWYELPQALIAQNPIKDRDKCRMLVLDRQTGAVEDKHFFDIGAYLNPGDLLVANETRVLPARLIGKKRDSGINAEILLLTPLGDGKRWEALVKPGRRLKPSASGSGLQNPIVDFFDESGRPILSAEITDWGDSEQPGMRIVSLSSEATDSSISDAIHEVGATPLPPYIHDYTGDMEMYQTVYSARESSAAAPTAGLHFTRDLISKLKAAQVQFKTVELEVGIDTFRPVHVENPLDHKMHTEMYSVSQDVIEAINKTKAAGNRIIAVGTTSVRSLESAWDAETKQLIACRRKPTSLFIYPGFKFNVVDGLITNFHVSESTLMMLVSAFAGYKNIMNSYKHAVDEKYRFLSFGDAMFIH